MLYTIGTIATFIKDESDDGFYLCVRGQPVWDNLLDVIDWIEEYGLSKEVFEVLADWGKDTEEVCGAPYRQTTDSFRVFRIDDIDSRK